MGIFDRFRRKEQPPKRRSYAGVNTSRLFADFSTMTRSSDIAWIKMIDPSCSHKSKIFFYRIDCINKQDKN